MTELEQNGANWFSNTGPWNASDHTLLQGKTNRNYLVVREGQKFHLKVRQHEEFPSFRKLYYVNELLASGAIPHAPVVATITQSKEFPHGAIIFTWQEGRSVADLTEYEELVPKVAATLKTIHSIKAPYYETIDMELRASSYADFIARVLSVRLKRCREEQLLDPQTETRLASFVSTINCGQNVLPVLVHRDATKSNVLIRPDQSLMLIDWDNAEFSAPLADIARIIFVYRWNFDLPKQNRLLSEYLGTRADVDEENILAVEYIRNALDGLIFKDADSQYCRMVLDSVLR